MLLLAYILMRLMNDTSKHHGKFLTKNTSSFIIIGVDSRYEVHINRMVKQKVNFKVINRTTPNHVRHILPQVESLPS